MFCPRSGGFFARIPAPLRRRPGRGCSPALCSRMQAAARRPGLLPGCGSPVPPSSGHKGRADRLPARRSGRGCFLLRLQAGRLRCRRPCLAGVGRSLLPCSCGRRARSWPAVRVAGDFGDKVSACPASRLSHTPAHLPVVGVWQLLNCRGRRAPNELRSSSTLRGTRSPVRLAGIRPPGRSESAVRVCACLPVDRGCPRLGHRPAPAPGLVCFARVSPADAPGCAALHTRAAFVAAARGGVAAPPPAPLRGVIISEDGI